MTIGLPRAMLYYRYHVLWETFFTELGCELLTSGETNKKTLSDGIGFSIDECCLPAKIYMGHVCSLLGRCDAVLVPRVVSYGKKDDVCVKFNALYDIVKNTFQDVPVLDYNIDVPKGETEGRAFVRMGRTLGFGPVRSVAAYRKAKRAQDVNDREKAARQAKLLAASGGIKILIVSHPYNCYDKLTGETVSRHIRACGGLPVYADAVDKKESLKRAKEMSDSLYWRYNKELVGAIKLLEKDIHGIVLLTAFPCGPDSLVNEVVIRKSVSIPTINIILDELQGEAGLQTRIESFLDIIKARAHPADSAASS